MKKRKKYNYVYL